MPGVWGCVVFKYFSDVSYTTSCTHARTSNVIKCKLSRCSDVYNEWDQWYSMLSFVSCLCTVGQYTVRGISFYCC